jgi:uncharacterized protein (DUF952 family)
MAEPVYKILSAAAYAEAEREGHFLGSADDLRDGFIHLSAAHQLAGTLARHFAGQPALVLLAVDPGRLGDKLKWEPSRSGELFPHLYAPLDFAALLWAEPLVLDASERHTLPNRSGPSRVHISPPSLRGRAREGG